MPLDLARIDALVFDVDGTLSDTDDHLVAQVATALDALPGVSGRRASKWARQLVMALETPTNTAYRLLDRLGIDDDLTAIKGVVRDARARLRAERRPGRHVQALDEELHDMVPDVAEMLAELAARYPISVFSTGTAPRIEAFLTGHGVRKHIIAVAGAQTTPRMKPYPEPLRYVAEAMGVAPERCLVIGDTTVDMETAAAVGAQAVGVLCGFGTEAELRREGAVEILATTSDVLGLLMPASDAIDGESADPETASDAGLAAPDAR